MAREVHLHIGPPKTGTTYLQAGWRSLRSELLDEGMLHSGSHKGDQFRACSIAIQHPVYAALSEKKSPGIWDRMITEAAQHNGDALFSSEFYARADLATATRIVSDLRRAAPSVHLVITARDLESQALASWQQGVKRGTTGSLDRYWARCNNGGAFEKRFWTSQGLPGLVDRWLAAGADRVTIVTVDTSSSDPTLLWRRANTAIGITIDTAPARERSNTSLGMIELEILRKVNARLPEDRDTTRVLHFTSKPLTEDLRALGLRQVPPAFDLETSAAVAARGDEIVAELQAKLEAGQFTLVGSLEDLRSVKKRPVPDFTAAEAADGAYRLIAHLVVSEVNRRNAAESAIRYTSSPTGSSRLRHVGGRMLQRLRTLNGR